MTSQESFACLTTKYEQINSEIRNTSFLQTGGGEGPLPL